MSDNTDVQKCMDQLNVIPKISHTLMVRDKAERDDMADDLRRTNIAAVGVWIDDPDEILADESLALSILLQAPVKGGDPVKGGGVNLRGEPAPSLEGIQMTNEGMRNWDVLVLIAGLVVRRQAKGMTHVTERMAGFKEKVASITGANIPELATTEVAILSKAKFNKLICLLDQFSEEHDISKECSTYYAYAIILENHGLSVFGNMMKITEQYGIKHTETIIGLNNGHYGGGQLVASISSYHTYMSERMKESHARGGKRIFDSALFNTNALNMKNFDQLSALTSSVLSGSTVYAEAGLGMQGALLDALTAGMTKTIQFYNSLHTTKIQSPESYLANGYIGAGSKPGNQGGSGGKPGGSGSGGQAAPAPVQVKPKPTMTPAGAAPPAASSNSVSLPAPKTYVAAAKKAKSSTPAPAPSPSMFSAIASSMKAAPPPSNNQGNDDIGY